ncbi:FHA domain-containing protein [Erwinia toletana]|uniref:FHA domain-containing protein n=1 Tax=Winslowiella toletana TaxID=92490 RepID=A0ABS4P7Z7_9GAMM|nr:type VI secretion system-associated FHA domain protein TagH [Winslowiella toletana]MBP2168767.1 FHA domain-containing protein [Winslowiella toletana]
MRFTIITNKPGHQPPQTSCDFLPPGGTIGRGADNNLVLPDDNRTISRLQAIVHIAASGECRITNRGNVTLVLLNDIPLERGRQVELQDGDVLGIDEYQLVVNEIGSQPRPAQPVATPRPAPQPTAQPQAAPPVPPQPQPPVQQAVAPAAAAEGKPAAIPTEIWDSLVQEFSISDSLSATRKNPLASESIEHINPLMASPSPERNPDDPLAQLLASDDALKARQSNDPNDLFGGDGLFDGESILDDRSPSTLAKQSLTPEPEQYKAEPQQDPLALFGGHEAGASSTISQDDPLGLMMSGAKPLTAPESSLPAAEAPKVAPEPPPVYTPEPPPIPDAQPPVSHAAETTPPPAASAETSPELADLEASPLFAELPSNQDISETSSVDYSGITLPTPQAVARNPAPPPKGRLRIDPVDYRSAPQAKRTASTPPPAGNGTSLEGELLQSLIDGMGLNDLQPVPQFDKAQMYQLGQMLSMFSQGTVALLSSRSILKRGVKAEMTVILDEANNPFKLLPSGKSVLMQMYGSRMPGFMAPSQSVRDALIDLQAHQLGMIAGIRAIIASMLQSFNPEQLEAEAREEGITSRIGFSSSRKAALWEHFTQRYKETAGEIEDDFHTLFGEAFLHAYDMEVNQYKDSQNRSDK